MNKMLAKLRILLAECHFRGDVVRTLANANYDYCVQRAQEEMDQAKHEPDPDEANRRLILATRLLTLARYKLLIPSSPSDTARPVQKRKSKKTSSPS